MIEIIWDNDENVCIRRYSSIDGMRIDVWMNEIDGAYFLAQVEGLFELSRKPIQKPLAWHKEAFGWLPSPQTESGLSAHLRHQKDYIEFVKAFLSQKEAFAFNEKISRIKAYLEVSAGVFFGDIQADITSLTPMQIVEAGGIHRKLRLHLSAINVEWCNYAIAWAEKDSNYGNAPAHFNENTPLIDFDLIR